MEVIKQHIDNMFQKLPETKEIQRIKNDLYLNALDRYDELIAQGKTESEAIGTIIIEIGDLDVLLEEFNYDIERDLKDHSVNSLEEAKNFLRLMRSQSNKIALGVFLILFGAGLIPTFETFNAVLVGVIALLILVAIAVGIFAMSGMSIENYERKYAYSEDVFYMSDDDYDVAYEEFIDFKEAESFRIPLGIMLSILSVIPIIIFSFMENELLIQRFGVIMLLTILGVGVSQFIKYGMVHSAFEKVLNLGEYSKEERQFQKRTEPIASIYWIFITLIYLTWSFLTYNWHISWVIWPIAGFIWGIISIILGMFIRKDETN